MPSRPVLRIAAILFVLIGVASLMLRFVGHGASVSHLGTNQRVLVICVKWSDVATTRLTNCSDWATLLQNEVNTFFDQATFGQTTFVFETPSGGPADGWYSLGYASSGYGFFKTGQDAITLADPNANFGSYNRVLVVTNFTGFGGQGGGPWWWTTADGIETTFLEGGVAVGKRLMTMAIVNEWQAHSFGNPFDEGASVAAHELGHQLGVPTHYADFRWHPGLGRDVITPWDVMGLSPTLNHFLGWPKNERGWIPSGPKVETVGPPGGSSIDTTIVLRPLESSGPGVQLIRIPFTSAAPFSGYLVENRRRINGDQHLPSEGVLISMLDQNPNIILPIFVLEDPGAPGNLGQAPLEVGDAFTDAARGITVSVERETGNSYHVRVQYLLPSGASPDPMITPWGAPPWETTDIWLDSEMNGWGTYKYTDASGNPTGNGDDAWVNHANRVYVRVRNTGPGVATNVRVQVYANDPPGMGDAGANWAYLGTIVFPTVAASTGTAQDFVYWTPTVGAHTCIKAVIVNTPGELSTTNNLAQENVTAFDTSTASPYRPVGLRIRVNNPLPNEKTPVRFHVRDIPPGWSVMVEPPEMVLPPAGFDWVHFMVFPSGSPKAELPSYLREQQKEYRPGFIGRPKIEALAPYADTFIPIGGVEVWTHLVHRTRLTCEAQGGGREPAERAPRQLEAPEKKSYPIAEIFERGALVRRLPPFPEVAVGQPVWVTGTLAPAGSGVVAVEFTLGKKKVLRLVKLTESGSYRVRFVPDAPGVWRAQAFFSGDATHEGAESDLCHVRVRRR